MAEDRRANVRGRHRHVVRVTERGRGPAVASEQAEPAIDVVELREVQRGIPDAVLELVAERAGAAVPDLAFEEVGPHAAASTPAGPISSAASKPERHPSSWNP